MPDCIQEALSVFETSSLANAGYGSALTNVFNI